MPTGKKKETASAAVPLIHFEEVAAERESFKLSWTVLANLREYVAYVREATGRDITADEVVDKCMQRLFDADKGFRQWLQKKNSEGRQSSKPTRTDKASPTSKSGITLEPGKPPAMSKLE